PTRPAIEGEADLVAEHLLHRLDAGDGVLHPALGEEAAIESAMERARIRFAVVEGPHLPFHVRVERDALLDDGETLLRGLHLADVLGVVLGVVRLEGKTHRTVIDANLVADLPPRSLWTGTPAALPAMSQSAISITLIAEP